MPIKPSSPRHVTQEIGDGVRVVIPSPRKVLYWIWGGIYLLMLGYMCFAIFYVWVYVIGGETGLLGDPRTGRGNPVLLIIFFGLGMVLLTLLIQFGAGIYTLLWHIAGKETIEANGRVLTVAQQIYGWKRSKEYSTDKIRDLRLNAISGNIFNQFSGLRKLLRQGRLIAFDYGAKTCRFGLEIDEAEAKQIIAVLQQYLPQEKGNEPHS